MPIQIMELALLGSLRLPNNNNNKGEKERGMPEKMRVKKTKRVGHTEKKLG